MVEAAWVVLEGEAAAPVADLPEEVTWAEVEAKSWSTKWARARCHRCAFI